MRRLNSLLGVVLLLLVVLVGVPIAFGLTRHRGSFTGTIAVGTSPTALAIDERTGHAFVVNRDDATVSMLDVARGTLVRTVPVGTMPVAVAVDERTACAFVVASNTSRIGVELGPGTVSVLDTRTGALLRTVTVGYEADAVAVDAQTDHVFIANGDGASVSILDAGSGRDLRAVALGLAPGAVAVDTATRRVFVASRGSNTVSMLDAVSGRVLRTIAVGTSNQGPVALAVDPTAGRVFVGMGGENGAGPMSVLDARTGALVAAAQGTAEIPLAVNPRGGRVFTLNVRTNTLSVRATRTGATVRTIPWTGSGFALDWQHSADIDARTGHVFVAAWDGTVRVLDGRTGQLLCRKEAGPKLSTIAVASRWGQLLVTNVEANSKGTPDAWGWVPHGLRGWLPWLAHAPVVTSPASASGAVTVLTTAC